MKLSKFLLRAVVITVIGVLYVWQQTEIVRLAYGCQKNFTVFQDLLDKNSVLRYNLKRSTSLTRIGNKLLESKDFNLPQSYRLVRVSAPKAKEGSGAQSSVKRENMVFRFLGVKREAEAKTINGR